MPFGKQANKILVASSPLVEELIIKGTIVKPELFLKKGTGDHQVTLAGEKRSLWAWLILTPDTNLRRLSRQTSSASVEGTNRCCGHFGKRKQDLKLIL